jgi:hypothetical protein
MHPMTEKKEQLKEMAKEIRELKSTRKTDEGANYKIYNASRKYRHEHIAYCLVRGRKYEEIENPGEFNKPYWYQVNKLKDELQKKVDKATQDWESLHPRLEISNG